MLAVIQGSTPTEDREYIRSQFTEDPAKEPVRVLLATDAAGEGIDLQTHCHRLVNFDIPFNPSRLEQRIGRIDRYGQTERAAGVPLRARRRRRRPTPPTPDFMAQHRPEGRPGRAGPRLGQPGHRRGDPAALRRGASRRRRKAKGVDANEVINAALAGGIELNARLTQLEQGYDASRAELHLEPANLRRVVDTALRLNHQLPLDARSSDRPTPTPRCSSMPAADLRLAGHAEGLWTPG